MKGNSSIAFHAIDLNYTELSRLIDVVKNAIFAAIKYYDARIRGKALSRIKILRFIAARYPLDVLQST